MASSENLCTRALDRSVIRFSTLITQYSFRKTKLTCSLFDRFLTNFNTFFVIKVCYEQKLKKNVPSIYILKFAVFAECERLSLANKTQQFK